MGPSSIGRGFPFAQTTGWSRSDYNDFCAGCGCGLPGVGCNTTNVEENASLITGIARRDDRDRSGSAFPSAAACYTSVVSKLRE